MYCDIRFETKFRAKAMRVSRPRASVGALASREISVVEDAGWLEGLYAMPISSQKANGSHESMYYCRVEQ